MEDITENMDAIHDKIVEVADTTEFPRETFIEIGNYALQIVHILQMDVKFTNKDGEPIELSDVILQDGSYINGLQVVITDSEGNFLATLDPKAIPLNDLYPSKEETPEVVDEAKKATQIIKDIQETSSEEFQPENGARLPNTATPYGNYIIVGVSLMAFSALGLFAARKKQAA